MLKIITRIDNDRQIFGFQYLSKSVGKFCAANSACKCNDFHVSKVNQYSLFKDYLYSGKKQGRWLSYPDMDIILSDLKKLYGDSATSP